MFFIIYFLSGIIGNIFLLLTPYISYYVPIFFSNFKYAGGASGAVYGVWASAIVIRKSLRGLLYAITLILLYDLFTPYIAWQVHLAGFITGLIITLITY
jgi:membrane associated rhomboid family serine protease